MEDEIEDIVGDVQYTDSQKSITICMSNFYSQDFTDSSSDKNNSSGKNTYIIEWDSSEDSYKPPHSLHEKKRVFNINSNKPVQYDNIASKSTSTSLHKCVLVAEETFTQTSKTIIELAENDVSVKKPSENYTTETQTSFISISENQSVEYKIQVSNAGNITKREIISDDLLQKKPTFLNICYNKILSTSLEDESSKYPVTETDSDTLENISVSSEQDRTIKIIDEQCKPIVHNKERCDEQYNDNSDFSSSVDSDMEQDSLMDITKIKKTDSVNSDVKELHNKLAVNMDLHMSDRFAEPDIRRFGTLTPLTEESNIKKDSVMDITPNIDNIGTSIEEAEDKSDVVFTSNTGMKVKYLRGDEYPKRKNQDSIKLPPIKNQSCPNSPHMISVAHVNKSNKLNKAGTLPCLRDGKMQGDSLFDRWEIGTKDLASGESALISDRSEAQKKARATFHLPPIRTEVDAIQNHRYNRNDTHGCTNVIVSSSETSHDPITIKEKIKELSVKSWTMYNISRTNSRSGSPASAHSPEENTLDAIADRGCEVLCLELLRRLRSSSCYEIVETLNEIPRVMEKFWGIITEQRIADFIRIVNGHIESPRPQVARSACNALASILKNTNYTKKPDFYEAVTTLLIKTGSYSGHVRRAANVALDDIVCGVDLSHAVAAICIHGAGHKSGLVRAATARLLVVCGALAGGGRDLLRCRPASAATARRLALRALAALLDDKSTDTRKYAERLYSMLRPLTNFEAYYLTDVDIELATQQMKKYDQSLLCGPPKEVR